MRKGRSEELITKRNRALVARYYYWSEIWEKRYSTVMDNLTLQEFFISEVTITREITKCESYLDDLRKRKPDIKDLACQFPGFSWVENMKVKKSKIQLMLTI